jgi:flagellar M-ring protein FliF
MALMIGGGVLLVIIILVSVLTFSGAGKGSTDPGEKKLTLAQTKLIQGAKAGKALEMQALLARQGIRLETEPGTGGTVSLNFDENATLNERDRAIITLVQSGLMDGNLGFEAFDSGDLMASREEKRIKLLRAQQGEIARIVRKITPIEDASVKISIPDPTIFANDTKPPTASIQVTIPPGDRLSRDKVRSIINLAVGSIQGLEPKNVALSDTNGNTYNSVLNSSMEMQDKAEEQDTYMKQKVSAQLDKLIGAGHYVVTVSTQLREARRETMVQGVDPSKSGVANKQRFKESLASQSQGGSGSGGPVSSFVPPELQTQMDSAQTGSEASRGYVREGAETTFDNGRIQYVESSPTGMVEDISIAVTIDDGYYPNIEPGALQQLIARSASPKVRPDSVTVARTDFQEPKGIAPETPLPVEANAAMTWMPWMIFSVVGMAVIVAILLATRRSKQSEDQLLGTRQEIEALRQLTAQQQAALLAQEQHGRQLMEAQQQQYLANQQAMAQLRTQDTDQLRRALSELKQTVGSELQPAMLGTGGLASNGGIPVGAEGGAMNPDMANLVKQWLEKG